MLIYWIRVATYELRYFQYAVRLTEMMMMDDGGDDDNNDDGDDDGELTKRLNLLKL